MTQYVAFLRGVNVGGKQPIKMNELAAVVGAAGFQKVRTIIASGNVIFESSVKDPARAGKRIEKHLRDAFGCEIKVAVRTVADLKAMIKRNPFKKSNPAANEMLFVTFFTSRPAVKPRLPLRSETEKMEVIAVSDSAAFIIARRKQTGWFGFPHVFAEKHFQVPTTTRNWTTLVKIVAAAEKE